MAGINRITPRKFRNICKHVKSRLKPSGSPRFDRETFFYAVYWQVCSELNMPMVFDYEGHSKVDHFQKQLQILIDKEMLEPFDAIQIASGFVNERLAISYSQAA
jgi:UV DNA damage repair endonuclease